MKKVSLFIIISITVISLPLGVFLLINAKLNNDSSVPSQVGSIEKTYNKLLKEIKRTSANENENLNEKFAEDYSRLFAKIAQGVPAYAKDYAELFREITHNTIEFEDDEVFSLAENISQFYAKTADNETDTGIQQIRFVENDLGKELLIVDYFGDVSGYSTRLMDEDEMEFIGMDYAENDGALGKYRIEIVLSDTKLSEKFINRYSLGKIYEIENASSKLNLRVSTNFSYGCFLYIGSDNQINIAEQEFTKLNYPMGSIELVIEK